jgi:hypothetical protein
VKLQGEQASADFKAAEDFKIKLEKIIKEDYNSPEQIFNTDETALYWKTLPCRTFMKKIKNGRRGLSSLRSV